LLSRFIIGKNKVLQIAFGKQEENTFLENSYLLSEVFVLLRNL